MLLYNLKEMNISKNIELKAERYRHSQKQNIIGYLSRYSASSLNSQSKLLTLNNSMLNKNVYLHHADTFIKRIQLKVFKHTCMSDKLNKYLTEVDFKGYILRWNSENAEKLIEKGQSRELNTRTSHYGKTSQLR